MQPQQLLEFLNSWVGLGVLGGALVLLLLLLQVSSGGLGLGWFDRSIIYAIALQDFQVAQSPADGTHLRIRGRPPGFFAWLAWLFGLGTDIRLDVTDQNVTCLRRTLNSLRHDSVLLVNVASVHLRSRRNLAWLFLGMLLLVAGLGGVLLLNFGGRQAPDRQLLIPATIVTIGLGLLLLLGYLLSRTFLLSIRTTGGDVLGVQFRPAIVGNLTVGETEAKEAVELLNELMLQQHSGATTGSGPRRR